ncbi:agmatine deiminase family protein [Streptomyces antimicrobicus]|uniref:Agmatine deiminase family protein n=1 Tax=Streptomyces antimicrobicus TaxID=2883108 RepID=A0ABS8B365_9ACTN|nr:agmatine deiminase family protein [Streptomyces antimicrobicus]MCB5179027.1 agmatine deiminase family protein [Streptomyces antimicrobicus]
MDLPRTSRRSFCTGALAVAAGAALGTTAAAAPAAAATLPPVVPAEWERHSRCVMAWPWDRNVGWGSLLKSVQAEVAAVAQAIARFEPVLMVAEPGTAAEARQQCGPAVTVIEYPINDCWARDTGPIFARNQERTQLTGLDFRFNGWGNKYPFDKDDLLPVGVCDHLAVPRRAVDLVLEGGAVLTDGQGTLITTEECLLDPNRNPNLTRAQIEAALLAAYGASKVVWLPYGLHNDTITNGHVDLVAAYLGPARVLLHTQPDPADPNHARTAANKAVLQAATDACGRPFQIVELHQQPHFRVNGALVETFSYTNYYLTSGSVVVPTAGVTADDTAVLAQFATLFPGREVTGIPCRTLAWGGGGIHCITQHVPVLG